jgi:NADH-quinone oxidoreductase subunit A
VLATFGAALTVFVAAVAAMLAMRWADHQLRATPLTAPERVPFTGGGEPEYHAWSRYHARYYVMALLFLAFDMEMVYMYPWAVVFAREGMVAFVEMGMFLTILLLGILYAWRERGLEWA